MNRYRMQFAPRGWSPALRPRLIRLLRSFRHRKQKSDERLAEVEIQGASVVRDALEAGHGVLITPNHSSHADPYSMIEAADGVGQAFYIMCAWQVFDMQGWLGQHILRWHGCFSVDREANDLRAFRQAIDILRSEPNPLVLFPEGEVYHCNERITPFREGAAAIALAAARKADRPIVAIPTAIRYNYLEDPTEGLLELMSELEQSIFWRPRPQLPLHERIYHFAGAILSLKEVEYLGRSGEGPLPDRIETLARWMLDRLEEKQEVRPVGAILPERVKELRRRVLGQLEEEVDPEKISHLRDDLDDLFLVVQSFSYPGDYVAERPNIERMAETLDKFEEDVLQRPTATVRGTRRAVVRFGEPVEVSADRKRKDASRELIETLEKQVQQMLEGD